MGVSIIGKSLTAAGGISVALFEECDLVIEFTQFADVAGLWNQIAVGSSRHRGFYISGAPFGVQRVDSDDALARAEIDVA